MERTQARCTLLLVLVMLSCPGCASRRRDLPGPPTDSTEPGAFGGIVRDAIQDASDSYRFGSRNSNHW
jgi:hypothetical protein